ncbi:AfsR/SARP family transcriptional regulator [Streptomyces sp. DT24]|uniref:AfsR/SARP family transcriptional regulator n=1 Tax=Streptomyces sp. DT24 TaxID=3416520 RepID=UPI003CF1A119
MDLVALGPLELWHRDQQYKLGSVKERCVLAVLVHARGEPVAMDMMIDRIWEDSPPPTGLDTLQSYVSRLRGRLRDSVGDLAQVELLSPRQYRLRVDPNDVDLLRFQRLRSEAGAAAAQGRRDVAIGNLRTAESMWRGTPLVEFTSAWAESTRARLLEDQRRVREERIRLELELGRHADLIGELHELASQNPLAQQVIMSLMLALYRSGRHDEALELYRNTRRRFHEGQGIEPGAELRRLHQRILDQDRTLMETAGGPVTAAADPAPAPPARNHLPRDIPDFTGRAEELNLLLGDMDAEDDSATTASAPDGGDTFALPVTVVHGMPGIGKTSLTVHAAHRLHHMYPDGLFYLDLHGFGGQPPSDPAEALAGLLHAAGIREDLPDSLDERVARWREWTARHRVLVVLDNARTSAQVRPLLPGAPTCRAIVTSRNRLVGLDGAESLLVDVLPEAQAAALFARIAGAGRVSAADPALTRVVEAAGRHPLALRLLASRFRHRNTWDLTHLLDRLARASDPFDEFDELAGVFRLSYAELDGTTRLVFRRLALHPGPDITLRAASALAGTGPDRRAEGQIQSILEELLDCHLVEEPVRGRYRLHDLIRAFGLRVCSQNDPAPARRAAVDRLMAHYLTAAHRADRTVHPHRAPLPPGSGPGHESPHAPVFADVAEASRWLADERANLLAVARAAVTEAPEYALRFPRVLAEPLKTWGAWDIAAELHTAAVSSLRGTGDHAALARTLVDRADVLAQKDHDEALSCATEALTLFQRLRDPGGCAHALLQSGRAHLAAGRGDLAHDLAARSRTLNRDLGDRHGEAECLNIQAVALHYAGRYDESLGHVREMLAIYEDLGDVTGQIRGWSNLGELRFFQGYMDEARDFYERSVTLARSTGDLQALATLQANLGGVHQASGRVDLALDCFRRALDSHRAGGDTLGEANALICMGTAYMGAGEPGEALSHFTRAEGVARSIDNAFELQRALTGVADAQRAVGRLDIAHETYERALLLAERIGFTRGSAQALDGLARTVLATGDVERARPHGRRAFTLYMGLDAGAEAEGLRRLFTEGPPG